MADNVGTYDISSLFQARFAAQSAAEFGFDNINDIFAQQLAFWNGDVTAALSALAMQTVERQGITGSSTSVRGVEVDEYGRGRTKKDAPGSTVAAPLDRLVYPLGKTSMWLLNATVQDIGQYFQSVQAAHLRDLRQRMKVSIYTSVNRAYADLNIDDVSLSIKAFLNADGSAIPDSPQDGASFNPATHDHYLAEAALSATGLQSLITTVAEHSVSADLVTVINRADVAAFSALSGFIPAANQRIQVFRNNSDPDVPFIRDDRTRTSDKYIGSFDISDVWVKPWGIADYPFCYDANAPKPLMYRQHKSGIAQGLRQKQVFMYDPLTVDFFETYFGFGVMTRTNGAVLYTAGGAYVDPTITG